LAEPSILQRRLPFWNQLSEAEQHAISGSRIKETFARGALISRSAEECKGLLLLTSGQIRAYILSDAGREITLFRLRAGDVCVLSASCVLDSIVFDVLIEAVEETEALLIPSASFHPVVEANPAVALFMATTANRRFSDAMRAMQQILFLGADRRVTLFLWEELTKTGSPVLFYTHDEIARLIGSAREVVTRVLKSLSHEGIVALGRGKLEILDSEKLKRLV